MEDNIKGLVYGKAIGDAIGVPSEFMSREQLKNDPIVGMIGDYGAHRQPKGTWSDDTSLMLALVDAMSLADNKEEFNLRMNSNLLSFSEYGLFTINGLFDIGITTSRVCDKINSRRSTDELKYKTFGEPYNDSNGNGGLMRILPCVLIQGKSYYEIFDIVSYVNSFTHKHKLNHYCCSFLVIFAMELKKNGNSFNRAFSKTCTIIKDIIYENSDEELFIFTPFKDFLLTETIDKETSPNLYGSTGFVFTTLTSVLMIYKNAKSYKEAVLEAANIGGDTDTIGAIVGGLYGYIHGFESIPKEYVEDILGKDQLDKAVKTLNELNKNKTFFNF